MTVNAPTVRLRGNHIVTLSNILTRSHVAFAIVLCCGLCCGRAQAASLLTTTPATIALTCDTATGPGPAAAIIVKPATPLTTNTIAVTLGTLTAGLAVTPPGPAILNSSNQSQGLTYSVSLAPGCAGITSGSATIRFNAGGIADAAVTATTTVTALASPLAASPVLFTCVRSAGPPISYTPSGVQTVSVTSAATGGTPFNVDNSTVPAWLTVTPLTGSIANLAGAALTMLPLAPCGNYLAGSSNSASIHLKNPPAPDGLIPVTLQVLGPSPLTAAPNAPSLSYTKGSSTPAFVDVALTSAGSTTPSFTVDPASLPSWLSVNLLSGAAPKTLRFSTTSVADTIAQGTYNATIRVQVAGAGDLAIPFRAAIGNPAPKLLVAEGTTRNISWTLGQALPIPYITLASSSSTIPYAIATGGALAPVISNDFLKGFVYSYDTAIPVTFSPNVFASAQAGSTLTGTVTITWGAAASTTVITMNIAVQSAAATVLGVAPSSLPTAAPGQFFTVALTGTGFGPTTAVGIVSGGALMADPNVASLVINPSNIILTITVPATPDPLLPFAPTGAGGTVTLGACNAAGAVCTGATGTAKLTINPSPMIQSVTSASTFIQTSLPSLATVAPFDMISLFGVNLCTSGGTGCSSDQVLYGTPDPSTLRFPVSLSPDPSGPGQRLLTVAFQTHSTPPVLLDNAPLLFATNGQINLLVPSAVAPYVGKSVDMVVNFGYASLQTTTQTTTMASSALFPVNIAAADPGIFTIGTDGQGDGAILGQDWSVIGVGNEAAMRTNQGDSDTVQIFMTGLGAPDGIADNSGIGAGQWPGDCVTLASYLSALNSQTSGTFPTLDGALIESSLLNTNRLAPCLHSPAATPTVTIGGQPGWLMYAGWVPGQVAGLYQLNVKLPGSGAGPFTSASGAVIVGAFTVPVQLPVFVTARGRTSQAGVTMWVAPRLKVTAPTGAGLLGMAGVAWSATSHVVTASQGTSSYKYALTAGLLPSGLVLNAATGAISGTPAPDAAGSYLVTVTATDSAPKPLTGSATFTLTIGPGH